MTHWGSYSCQAREINFYGDKWIFNLLKIIKLNNRDITTARFEFYGKFTLSMFVNLL